MKAGVDPARVEAVIAEELKKFLAEGPTQDELDRAKIGNRAQFVRGLEKVGGFGGKAVILAEGQVYRGDPAAYKKDLERSDNATIASVKAASDVYSPLAGKVVEINEPIVEDPSIVNSDAEGEGWFFRLELDDPATFDELMDQDAYDEFLETL